MRQKTQQDIVRDFLAQHTDNHAELPTKVKLPGLYQAFQTHRLRPYDSSETTKIALPGIYQTTGVTRQELAESLCAVILSVPGLIQLSWDTKKTTVDITLNRSVEHRLVISEEDFVQLFTLVLKSHKEITQLNWTVGEPFVTIKYISPF